MMNLKLKRLGLEYADRVGKTSNKEELFNLLFSVVDREVRFEDLHLVLSPVLARLEAVKATIRMRNNEARLQNILKQLKKPNAMDFDEVLVNKLTFCSPSPADYAYIAFNHYLEKKMGKADDFRNDWMELRTQLSGDIDMVG